MTYDAAKAIIINNEDEVLFVRSRKHITLPGGKRDEGENNPLETLARELKEELPGWGFRFDLNDDIDIYIRDGWTNIVFRARVIKVGSVGQEIIEYDWLTTEKAKEHEYWGLYFMTKF